MPCRRANPTKRRNLSFGRSDVTQITWGNSHENPYLVGLYFGAALVGCGGRSTYVKEEKVVEKQPVVTKEREVIIEKQVAPAEIVVEKPVPALRSCTYGAAAYSHGSLSCQVGYEYRCSDGTWVGRNLAC
jgi:hypothetical protein